MRSEAFRRFLGTPRGASAFGPLALAKGIVEATELEAPCRKAWTERAAREVAHLEVLRKLNEALKAAGIPAWLLKGPSLAYRLYDSPLHRPCSDLDILVSEHRWKDFVRVLQSLGAEPGEPGGWLGTEFRRVFMLNGVPVEGHRQILTGRDLEGLSRWHSQASVVPGLDWFREFETNLLFVYLCGHGAFQHLFDHLHWLVDLDLLARKETLDPAAIERLAVRLRLRRAVCASAAVLRAHFDSPLPKELEDAGLATRVLARFLSSYLAPERLVEERHRRPRSVYLGLKGLLRDRLGETLAYGLSRSFNEA
jgi:hypothetical protein